MLTSIRFERFRGFQDLSIAPLKRVNLLIGSNGSGKTCVLEGLYFLLLNSHEDVDRFPSMLRMSPDGEGHEGTFVTFWKWLFYDQNARAGLRLEAALDDGTSIRLDMTETRADLEANRQVRGKTARTFLIMGKNGPVLQPASDGLPNVSVLAAQWTDPAQDADLFNLVMVQREGEHKMEDLMRVVEPRLQRLRYARLPGCSSPLVYADLGLSAALPFTQMGQGFSRILRLYCQVEAFRVGEVTAAAKRVVENVLAEPSAGGKIEEYIEREERTRADAQAQVLLVDEIENGIYHRALPQFWKGLLALCEAANVQLFATTHSRECMMAADAAARERPSYDLAFVRLDRLETGIKATVLDDQTMKTAREFDWEMR